jgi:trans-2,3-dihydro-3-hydroxyanthranilate isomerase
LLLPRADYAQTVGDGSGGENAFAAIDDDSSMTHRVAYLDVFAERPLAGNGLAVVDDADGVSDEVMLAFARETRLSETTFVQSAREKEADYRNRIFTVEQEVPFAGHPTLGTAVAIARWQGLERADFVQETHSGLQPIEVRSEGEGWRASMVQNEAEFAEELDPGAAMAVVGLGLADAHPELPPQLVSTGLPSVIVPVAAVGAIAGAEPDLGAIDELLAGATLRADETPNFYLVWCDPDGERARARMFSSGTPGGEDPATGSAAGPLCAYLAKRTGRERLVISQGEEMGRPSVLETEMEAGRPRVSGSVIPLIEGTVALPGG